MNLITFEFCREKNYCFRNNFLCVHYLTVLKQGNLNKAVFRLGPSELRELRLSVVPVCPGDKKEETDNSETFSTTYKVWRPLRKDLIFRVVRISQFVRHT